MVHDIETKFPWILNKQLDVSMNCFSPNLMQTMGELKTGLTSFEPHAKYRPTFCSFINSSVYVWAKSEYRQKV